MKNTVTRIILFIIVIPILILSALLLPSLKYPLYALLTIGSCIIVTLEISKWFTTFIHSYRGYRIVFPLLATIIPATGYVAEVHFSFPRISSLMIIVLFCTTARILTAQTFRHKQKNFHEILISTSLHFFVLLYPGIFAWHALRIITLPNTSLLIILFLLSTYFNDSTAWLIGKFFTQNNHHPLVVISPNKSLAGFIAGFSASLITVSLFAWLFPHILPGSAGRHLLFGSIIGIAAIFGDLIESALKRSASVKDSGILIPGRGGLFDSVDSPLFTAPFFFYGYLFIYCNSYAILTI